MYVRTHLLDVLDREPSVHRAYAGVAVPNEASIALHVRLRFERVGTFSEVGFKFDQYWNVVWFERSCESISESVVHDGD